jgi:hypothetical protein
MATVSITVPDAVLPRVVAAFAATFGYAATMPDGTANPETQNAFVKRKVAEYIKAIVVAHEANRDADAARAATLANSTSQLTIT